MLTKLGLFITLIMTDPKYTSTIIFGMDFSGFLSNFTSKTLAGKPFIPMKLCMASSYLCKDNLI
jgi:hypothetical protein